jgi:hypothetical protein
MLAKILRHERENPYVGDGIRPAPVPVEPAFDAFVETFGGTKISALLSNKSALPLNADYFFAKDNVVAELKMLEGSFAGQDGVPLLLNALHEAGVTTAEVWGYFFRGEPLPKGSWHVLNKRFRRYVEDRIKKGRAQLKRSKLDVGNATTKSVLLIANEKIKLIRDDRIFGVICDLMATNYNDAHIDAVIYFSPNVFSFHPGAEREYSSWIPAYRNADDEQLGEFINSLGEAWLKYYTALCGEPNLPILQFPDTREGIETLRGRRRPYT